MPITTLTIKERHLPMFCRCLDNNKNRESSHNKGILFKDDEGLSNEGLHEYLDKAINEANSNLSFLARNYLSSRQDSLTWLLGTIRKSVYNGNCVLNLSDCLLYSASAT